MFHDEQEEKDYKSHREDLLNRATLAIPKLTDGCSAEFEFILDEFAQAHARMDRVVRWVEATRKEVRGA